MMPRFFWARRKMLTKFQQILDKSLPELYDDVVKTKLVKRYNPMFYPSWQERDGTYNHHSKFILQYSFNEKIFNQW